MNIQSIIDDALALSKTVASALGETNPISEVINIGEKVADILGILKPHTSGQTTADLEAAHAALVKEVSAKADRTSDRLRNG